MESKEIKTGCSCSESDRIVVSCSGACDLGQLSDLVARRLRDNKVRKMNCLAAVAADVKPTIEAFKSADMLLIDGCAVDCGKKIFEKAEIVDYKYIRLTDFGFAKGQTPVDEETISKIYDTVLAGS